MGRFQHQNGRRSGLATGPSLILSHGFGTDQDAWTQLRPWLDQHFDVISYDLAGCGPAGAGTYDFDRHGSMFGYADDLIEMIDELQLQNCLYIGHSMSGMIGAAAAVARPDLFAQLVMVGASARYLNDDNYRGGFEPEGLEQLFAAMAANYQAWVTGFAPMVVGVDSAEAVADFSRTLFSMRPDIALATSRTIFNSDLRELAAQVQVPVGLIQTGADVAVPLTAAQWLAENIPQANLQVINAEGHLPHMTASAELRLALEAQLRQFLC